MIRREKFKHDYGLEHIYKFYKKKYNDTLNYTNFSKVIKLFNEKFINQLYAGAYMSLPYLLGDMFIYKYKRRIKFDSNGEAITFGKRGLIDYKATNELWKEYPELAHKQRVCYDNSHTDRYSFKIKWKRYDTLRMHKLYNFIAARKVKRNLASYLRIHPNQDYYDK